MPRQSKDQVLYDMHNHCVNLNLRDIYLHSYYIKDDVDEPGVDYRQATTFIKNLHMLDTPPYKPILVHLQSTGGDWDNGMAMFNAIQFASSYVIMLAYSQASSMSGVVFQAAPLRVMMPDCHFMMHYGWGGGGSNHPYAIKSEAEFGVVACKRMLEIFAERAVKGQFFKQKKSTTVQSVYNFFDKKLREQIDWYLDSEETVYYGLADDILGSKDYPDIRSLREV